MTLVVLDELHETADALWEAWERCRVRPTHIIWSEMNDAILKAGWSPMFAPLPRPDSIISAGRSVYEQLLAQASVDPRLMAPREIKVPAEVFDLFMQGKASIPIYPTDGYRVGKIETFAHADPSQGPARHYRITRIS